MEKVVIKTAVDTGRKTKTGSPIINVELDNGKKCTAFDINVLGIVGVETEMEVKDAPEYQGEKGYYIYFPKAQNIKYAKKDWVFEKKKVALEIAVRISTTVSDTIKQAEEILQWLNK